MYSSRFILDKARTKYCTQKNKTKWVQKNIATNICDFFLITLIRFFPYSFDYQEFIRLTEINSVSGIIGYVFNQAQNIDYPDKIKQFYTEAYFSTIAITTIRDEAMKSVIELLSKNGIDHLLFKGYVVRDLYTVPELRTFGDIDFAIRLEDRAKSTR